MNSSKLIGQICISVSYNLEDLVTSLLHGFPAANTSPEGSCVIECSARSHLTIDFEQRQLIFQYREPRDSAAVLRTQVGLLQALARFASLLDLQQTALLLHGSTAVTADGDVVAFLDDGNGRGKSTLAYAIAQRGGAIVADEFSFYSVSKRTVLGGEQWPVHLRTDVLATLGIKETEEVHAHAQRLGIPSVGEAHLTHLVFPRIHAGRQAQATTISRQNALDRLRITATDHVRKLLSPKLDRVSYLDSPDSLTLVQIPPMLELYARCEAGLADLAAFARCSELWLTGLPHMRETIEALNAWFRYRQ
jgi:hypothetical protein